MDFANEFKEMRREIRDLKTATPNSGGGGGSYTAGDGIDITDNEISVDDTIARTTDIKDGRLTIQHNGETVQTFTANQEPNSTANIETIYADDVIDVEEVSPTITTDMIQDSAITTSKIQNNAVTAEKIGWSSMPYVNYTNSNSVSSLSTSWTNLYSFSVSSFPTGAVIAIMATVQLSVNSTADMYARISYAGNTGVHSVAQSVAWGHHLPIVDCITKTAGYNTVYIQGMVSGSSNWAWGCRVVAYRIA